MKTEKDVKVVVPSKGIRAKVFGKIPAANSGSVDCKCYTVCTRCR
jgi:hypothetical protein